MKPSKILSIVPAFNRDPSSVGIDVLCSLCEEVDTLEVSYTPESDVSWLRRNNFYFVCRRHRQWESN
jgi:hypothetical protein